MGEPVTASSLSILYRDAELVVVDKPSGWLVHRGWSREGPILMAEVRDHIGQWVYPIHRLDRGTSGVVALALSEEAHRHYSAAFAEGRVVKDYRALVRGRFREALTLDHPVKKGESGPRVDACTEFTPVSTNGAYSWVAARPRTGRTHQIRRHLKHLSHPIIGDVRYGKGDHNRRFRERYGLHRLALHCLGLQLPSPRGEDLRFAAPVPEALLRALDGEGLRLETSTAAPNPVG